MLSFHSSDRFLTKRSWQNVLFLYFLVMIMKQRAAAQFEELERSLKQQQSALSPEGSQESLNIADNVNKLLKSIQDQHTTVDEWCKLYR